MKHAVVTRKSTGIGSDLMSVVGAFHYARKTGRDLVIDWRDSRYLYDPRDNLFPLLFHMPSEIDGVDIFVAREDFGDDDLPGPVRDCKELSFAEFHEEMLRPPGSVHQSMVVTRPMHHLPPVDEQRRILSRIRPVEEISALVDDYAATNLAGHRVAGIHVRHGNGEQLGFERDRLVAHGPGYIVNCCAKAIDATACDFDRVFLCTDSEELRAAFKAGLDNVCHYPSDVGRAGEGRIHSSTRGLVGAEHAVAEMQLLGRVDFLVYNPSWFSHPARVTGVFTAPPFNIDTTSDYGTMRLYEKRLGRA